MDFASSQFVLSKLLNHLIYFVIRTSYQLERELQMRFDGIIWLRMKLDWEIVTPLVFIDWVANMEYIFIFFYI
jgi:hypothetical protein